MGEAVPVKNKLEFSGQVFRERVKMSRQYTCNYCQSNHTGKEALYEHIHNTPSCSSMHNTRRGSRRQRDVERRQRNGSRNNTEPRRRNTNPPSPPAPRREDVIREDHPEGEDEPSEGEQTCVICLANKPQIISTRCGHLCCCVGCSKRLYQRHDKCPKCRGLWDNLLRVFS